MKDKLSKQMTVEFDKLYNNLSEAEKASIQNFNHLLNDKDFRKKLMATPEETLTELGFQIPEGKKIRVLESGDTTPLKNSTNELYIKIPGRQSFNDMSGELNDEELLGVVGGHITNHSSFERIHELVRGLRWVVNSIDTFIKDPAHKIAIDLNKKHPDK